MPPLSRLTVPLHGDEGSLGYYDGLRGDVSMKVTAPLGIVAERPVYFNYPGNTISGGHDVMGATGLGRDFFFAEGCTGCGFEEWVCVLNPQERAAGLTFRFQTQEAGEKVVTGCAVPAHSRATFKVNDLLGPDLQASLALSSDQPVLAERAMYFDYQGRGAHGWKGGHCVMGATAQHTESYFAEGTTRDNFEEWLTLQNTGASSIKVTAEYQFGPGQGAALARDYTVGAGRRLTLYVPDEVGPGKDVSVRLTSSFPFLAERPVYFEYTGWESDWTGGHCVTGAAAPGPAVAVRGRLHRAGFPHLALPAEPHGQAGHGGGGLPHPGAGSAAGQAGDHPARFPPDPAGQRRRRGRPSALHPAQGHGGRRHRGGTTHVFPLPAQRRHQPDRGGRRQPGQLCPAGQRVRLCLGERGRGHALHRPDLRQPGVHHLLRGRTGAGQGVPLPRQPGGAALPARLGGVDVVSQANNHARDYGGEAMLDCLAYLRPRASPGAARARITPAPTPPPC